MKEKKYNVLVVIILMIIILICFTLAKERWYGNVLWTQKAKGNVLTALLLSNQDMAILTTDRDVRCYKISDGSMIWDVDVDGGSVYYTPIYSDGEMYIGGNGIISRIDMNSGLHIRDYLVDGKTEIMYLEENNIYYGAQKGGGTILGVLDPITGMNKEIARLKGEIESPLLIHEQTIIAVVYIEPGKGILYGIDKNNGNFKWNREIYNDTIRANTRVATYNEKLYMVDMSTRYKNILVEIDINNGHVLKEIRPARHEWYEYEEYTTTNNIKHQGETILSLNRYENMILYDMPVDKLSVIEEKAEEAIIHNRTIIYAQDGYIYAYDIDGRERKSLYAYGKEEISLLASNNEYLFIVMARDLPKAMANDEHYTYKMIKIR
jgi:outer membrane protein assembly factor BamB